jgi:RNA polymerase sigma-70 factor (ECF subfamily)
MTASKIFSSRSSPERSAERSDKDLLAAIQAGDEAAFEELMRRKTGRLLAAAYRIVGDREEAKDLVQLVFLRVWEKSRRFNGSFSVDTWLYRITTNLAIDTLRARQVRTRHAEPVRHHLLRVVAGQRPGDFERLLGREVLSIVRDLASGLSRRQRQAFLLREVEGLSSQEVAKVLGCAESTVRNHLFTARKYLRRELLERFPEYAAAVESDQGDQR